MVILECLVTRMDIGFNTVTAKLLLWNVITETEHGPRSSLRKFRQISVAVKLFHSLQWADKTHSPVNMVFSRGPL